MTHDDLEVSHYLEREEAERAMSRAASCCQAKELHQMLADRHADHAWSLAEANDEAAFVPSGLWTASRR